MLIQVVLHLTVAACAPLLVRWWGRRAFWVLALPSLGTVIWALARTPAVVDGRGPSEMIRWAPEIGLELGFRLDTLAWLMTLVVAGIGVLVLLYCADYFEDDEPDLGRFSAHLTAFAGAMVGLVTSDNLLLLYLFWELTTVLSYLLIGHVNQDEKSRSAATQALVVTTAGGLAMLCGLVILANAAGSYELSTILAHPPSGTVVSWAVFLILLGAISKSALVPIHFWLPGAMAAPTPVSAYLHAAAMVKAGIYLVARFAPGFAEAPPWRPTILILGALTMLVGGYRALRQHDLKLLLAFGTVSQLGFLMILVGAGTREAALAGVTMLVAHALFKSGLFLTVGSIDHATGTRDLRKLSGLRRSMPLLFWSAVLCGASMAGVPPLLGFVGKEAAYTSLLYADAAWGVPLFVVVMLGSILTFAYTARFLWGAFGTIPGKEPTSVHPLHPLAVAVPVTLAAASLVAAPLSGLGEPYLDGYVDLWPAGSHPAHLGLWHGLNLVLLLSLVTLALGAVLFAWRSRVAHLQQAMPEPPSAISAYRLFMRGLDRLSLEVTGGVQRGSLPLTLGLILLVLIVLPGGSILLGGSMPASVRAFDNPAQLGVAVLATVAAVAAVRSRRRMRGVILVGVTGYAAAVLFLVHGAPDLALTQTLVETLSLVVFVLVLRRLSGRFDENRDIRHRTIRVTLGVLTGAVVTGATVVAAGARTQLPASVGWPKTAYDYGGGGNIVNVALVDIRAWDTMGEISVVLVAATGVASLVYLSSERLSATRARVRDTRSRRGEQAADTTGGWLPEGDNAPRELRSLLLEIVTRVIFHAIMVWSLFLLFVGHNQPGGGFAAGIVAGLALTVRYLAGGAGELRAALPVMPGLLLGSGLFLSAGFGVVSMLAGGDVLQTWDYDLHLPLIGELHLVTSVFFDIGVYLVVIGLVLDILRSLGSGLDAQINRAHEEVNR